MMNRGQLSVEVLMVTAFLLMLSIPAVALLYNVASTQSDDASSRQAVESARKLAEAADTVYIFGGNGSQRVPVVIPPGTQRIIVGGSSNKEIVFVLLTANGLTEGVAITIANVSNASSWNTGLLPGVRYVNVTRGSNGVVYLDS